jgi:hypothetical protein
MAFTPENALNAAGVAFPAAWETIGGVKYAVNVLALADGTQVGPGSPLPVSLASSVAVTGTFWQTTQPVSIAAPVAVTGTFWQATQPVSGPLTDAQLRATAVPVSGTVALGSGSANIGDVDVLTVPTIATTTRALDYANGVTVTAGATTSASAAITATEICIHNAGAVRAYVRQGSGTPTASVAATSLAMEPGEKIWLRHTSGHAVAAIRDGASDCAIRIIPVA